MEVWIKIVLIFIIVLIGDWFVYQSAKAKAQAEMGEKFIHEMMPKLKEIDVHECVDTYECQVDIAKLDTWSEAADIIRKICDV